jgi:transposase-like protein
MKKARRKHSAEFKREAVALVTEQGYSCGAAGRSLGAWSRFCLVVVSTVRHDSRRHGSWRELTETTAPNSEARKSI